MKNIFISKLNVRKQLWHSIPTMTYSVLAIIANSWKVVAFYKAYSFDINTDAKRQVTFIRPINKQFQ